MRVIIEGGQIEEFDFDHALENWRNKQHVIFLLKYLFENIVKAVFPVWRYII